MLNNLKKNLANKFDFRNPQLPKSLKGLSYKLQYKFKLCKNSFFYLFNKTTYPYFMEADCRMYIDKFFPFLQGETFQDDYLKLIKDLDDKSIQTVSKIINRLTKMRDTGDFTSLLSKEEKEQIQKLNADFYQTIIKFNNNLWAYKHYLLPTKDFLPEVFYYRHFIDTFKTFDHNKAIIDVGCFIGDSALVFSEYTNDTVYSFEPLTYNFNIALKTMELNNIKNIKLENFGLSDKKSDLNITVSGLGSSISTSSSTTEATQLAHFETLDDYVAKNKIKVGFIKADIEGEEQFMLAGAKKTICEQKPALCICIYHSADDFFHIKTLIESWNLGYTFRIVQPVTGHMHGDTVLLAEVL